MIHIICDTTACLRDEFVERHDNLHMIPLHIALGGAQKKFLKVMKPRKFNR